MKLVFDKKLGKMVEAKPPKPHRAASTRFDKPSKKPLKTVKGPRELKRGGYLNHESDAAGVHPSQARAETIKAHANGHSNISFDEKTGACKIRNGNNRQWRKFLKSIGQHDKMSFF